MHCRIKGGGSKRALPMGARRIFCREGGDKPKKRFPTWGKLKKHIERVLIIIFFLQNNGNFLRQKSDQNIHENARNCTIFSMFLGGSMSQSPVACVQLI